MAYPVKQTEMLAVPFGNASIAFTKNRALSKDFTTLLNDINSILDHRIMNENNPELQEEYFKYFSLYI